MYYKEFLRIRNIFAGFAIAMLLLALFIFAMAGHAKFQADLGPSQAPAHVHAAVRHAAPPRESSTDTTTVIGPNVEVSSDDLSRVPVSLLFAIAGMVAAIFATVLGTCLAAENCGHLEIAWTRPASRTSYAAGLMLVDAAGILAMFAFTLLVSVALIYASGWQHSIDRDPDVGAVLARFLLYPFAWFALIAGLTASVRNKAGGIAGFSWLGAGLLIVLLSLQLPPSMHAVVQAVNYLNPMLWGSYSSGPVAAGHVLPAGTPVSVIGLSGIIVIGIIAALAQWRRLEA